MLDERRKLLAGFASLLILGVLPATVGAASRTQRAAASPPVEVSSAIQHDVSAPLRDIPSAEQSNVRRERPLRPIPADLLARAAADPVVQIGSGSSVATTSGLNFAGVGDGDYGFVPNAAPPDTNGAVGATQYVQ